MAITGFGNAKPGGTFIKIGVGVLKNRTIRNAIITIDTRLPIRASGLQKGVRLDQFTQEVNDRASGYGYVYRKTVRLVKANQRCF
jgi:hypothetical protein